MSSQLTRNTFGVMAALASLWLAAACAVVTVNSYVDRNVDFRQYRTYAWGSPDAVSTSDPRLDNNRFFDERVRAQIEHGLARRGFEKTASQQPDLIVHYHANVTQEIDIYDKGTLYVDLMEPRTSKLIWRGWAEGSFDGVVDNQRVMETRIDDAVARVLARLPSP